MARVLVIDDQRISRVTLQAMLEEAAYTVRTAETGAEGLEVARAWGPDIVILDLNMPGMDGFEVVERLKAEASTATIPVIFLTGEPPTDELIVRGLDLGAYDFLGKGGSKAELLARVAAMARLKRGYDELAAFARISDALLRTVEPNDLMAELAEQTCEVFRADGSLVLLQAPEAGDALTAGARVDADEPLTQRFAEALLAVIEEGGGSPVLIGRDEMDGPAGAWLRRHEFAQAVATMVRRADGAPLLLAALSREATRFRGADPPLMHTLAKQATVAMERALLHAERRKQTLRLRRQAEQLERAMTERSRFFASLSHEIRTPINAVIGYNQLLADGVFGGLSDQQKQAVENVERSADHLLELINDILDISKLEAGKFEVVHQDTDLAALVRSMVTSVRLQADEKGLELKVEAPETLTLRTDPARVRQIVLNLLSNAVKFTDEGGVTVRVAKRDADGRVLVSVRDSGPGIRADDLARIFDEFEQVEGGGSRGGTGLGLAISRKLAALLGGDLRVSSERGVGSTFTLELPSRPASEERQGGAGGERPSARSLRSGRRPVAGAGDDSPRPE